MSDVQNILNETYEQAAHEIVFKTSLAAFEGALSVCDDSKSRKRIQGLIDELKSRYPQFNPPKPPFDPEFKDAEVIEFTETFGEFNRENSNRDIKISTLEEAKQFLLDEKIAGFKIGGDIDGRWSPIGVVRKWGTEPGFVQIKNIDFLGREGSGVYSPINSIAAERCIDDIVDRATINSEGMFATLSASKGKILTEQECAPKFRAL